MNFLTTTNFTKSPIRLDGHEIPKLSDAFAAVCKGAGMPSDSTEEEPYFSTECLKAQVGCSRFGITNPEKCLTAMGAVKEKCTPACTVCEDATGLVCKQENTDGWLSTACKNTQPLMPLAEALDLPPQVAGLTCQMLTMEQQSQKWGKELTCLNTPDCRDQYIQDEMQHYNDRVNAAKALKAAMGQR